MTLTPSAPFDGDDILSLDDAKVFLRVDADDEDALIGALRDAAIDWVERYTGRGLSQRAWVWTADSFHPTLRPSIRPIVGVTGISYFDGVASVELADGAWRVAGDEIVAGAGMSWPCAWRSAGAVRVTVEAGYAAAAREAPALLAAVKMLLAHLYRNRETVITGTIAVDVPMGVTALCQSYRSAQV